MIAKIRLDRNPPVRRNSNDGTKARRIGPENQLCVGRQWAVAGELEIEQIVEKTIRAEAEDALRERAPR